MSLLEAQGVTKRFAGITALDNVSLNVEPGETVGLIGPNGAGKTTFFNCLLGLIHPDEGAVMFRGVSITSYPIHRRAKLGIGRTFQRMELFGGMTVREHLLVAERARLGTGNIFKDLLNMSAATANEHRRVNETLELVGLQDVADAPIEALGLGKGRLVEMARALMTDASLLLLDEPSSGLDYLETKAVTEMLITVRRERGTAILLVEHDVEMVSALANRLFVLDFGVGIASGSTHEVLADAEVRRAYLGEVE